MRHAKTSGCLLGAALLLPIQAISAGNGPRTYLVKARDTLSEIAANLLGKPIYSANGSLAQLLKANPEIQDPHFLKPGQVIQIRAFPNAIAAKGALTEPASSARLPAEASAAVIDPDEEDKAVRSTFGLGFGFQYFRIDAMDRATRQEASFLSNLAPEARFTWNLAWNARWSSTLALGLRKEEVLDFSKASADQILGARGHRLGFSIGAIRNWSESSATAITLGREEEIFERALSQSSIQIDRVGLPTIGFEQTQRIFSRAAASAGFALAGKFYLPAKRDAYSTKLGWQLLPKAYLQHDLSSFTVHSEAYFGLGRLDSTLVEQNTKSAGLLIQISRSFEK